MGIDSLHPLSPQAGGAAELARCAELLTEEELQYCGTAGEEGVQRERVLARALVRCGSGIVAGLAAPRHAPAWLGAHPICPPVHAVDCAACIE